MYNDMVIQPNMDRESSYIQQHTKLTLNTRMIIIQ